MSRTEERLLQYGVSSDLADKAAKAGLSVNKIRTLSQADMTSKFGLKGEEAAELVRCVRRVPIDENVIETLLSRSNHVCCVCKGQKGHSYVIHHIEPYEKTQDNNYGNLVVLCPSDHDLAHRSGGLTLSLSASQLQAAKIKWEHEVEVANAQRAARSIQVNEDAVDYINIMRIEALCIQMFNEIPKTNVSDRLISVRILTKDRHFNEPYVRDKLSRGSYLFDYINHSEAAHYQQLLTKLSEVIEFADLSEAARKSYKALKVLEGVYSFFIGGVYSNRPERPITRETPPVTVYWPTRKVRIEWLVDPNYLMSSSSIGRLGQKSLYIIYGLIRSVERGLADQPCRVIVSPLLIALPSKHVDRTPGIAYRRSEEQDEDLDWLDDEI